MAAFLQDGIKSRIPRRGKIGGPSDQIILPSKKMSGAVVHRQMNAVRMNK